MTTLKNRKSCIITDSGLTINFDILLGLLQGDLLSPNVFKVCVNPLLLKMCLSLVIKIPPQIPFRFNINISKSDVSSAFADDINSFFSPTPEALQEIVNIILKFSQSSNLKINQSKTKVVHTGGIPTLNFLRKMHDLGFELENNFKVLGLRINKDLTNMNMIWDSILEKVSKIRNFWALFNLSIPGRVNIIKCYFLSQLSYLGSILEPPDYFIQDFETCIVTFLKSGGKIARERIFSDVDNGGLGIPRIKDFMTSIKINIFLRGLDSKDCWGLELKSFLMKDNIPSSINDSNINENHNPILYNLIKAIIRFFDFYWKFAGNILSARILYNYIFKDLDNIILSCNFFTNMTWNRYSNKLLELSLSDFINEHGNLHNYQSFCYFSNIFLTPNEYLRLCHCLRTHINRHKNKFLLDSLDVNTFLKQPNLKSKNFRKFLESTPFKLKNCKPTKTRYSWCNAVFDISREKRFISTWNFSFLPMNIRDFAFKFINNQVYLNANLSHFNNLNINAACFQCTVALNLPPPKESYPHFFMYCPLNNTIIKDYFDLFLSHTNINWFSCFSLLGAPSNISFYKSLILNIEIILVNNFLYKCKIAKKIPCINLLTSMNNDWRKTFLCFEKYKSAWLKWNLQH